MGIKPRGGSPELVAEPARLNLRGWRTHNVKTIDDDRWRALCAFLLFDRHVELKLSQANSERSSRRIYVRALGHIEHLDLHSATRFTDRYSDLAVQRWGTRISTHSPERSPAAIASAFASSV